MSKYIGNYKLDAVIKTNTRMEVIAPKYKTSSDIETYKIVA